LPGDTPPRPFGLQSRGAVATVHAAPAEMFQHGDAGLSSQKPARATFVPVQLAVQLLSYVLPLQPQTTSQSCGHAKGIGWHSPSAPQAPDGVAQYSPEAHSLVARHDAPASAASAAAAAVDDDASAEARAVQAPRCGPSDKSKRRMVEGVVRTAIS
jgi:hypothetical protein